jgi:hypothetical protein
MYVYILIILVQRYVRVVVERKLDRKASKMIEGNRKRKKITMIKHLDNIKKNCRDG